MRRDRWYWAASITAQANHQLRADENMPAEQTAPRALLSAHLPSACDMGALKPRCPPPTLTHPVWNNGEGCVKIKSCHDDRRQLTRIAENMKWLQLRFKCRRKLSGFCFLFFLGGCFVLLHQESKAPRHLTELTHRQDRAHVGLSWESRLTWWKFHAGKLINIQSIRKASLHQWDTAPEIWSES